MRFHHIPATVVVASIKHVLHGAAIMLWPSVHMSTSTYLLMLWIEPNWISGAALIAFSFVAMAPLFVELSALGRGLALVGQQALLFASSAGVLLVLVRGMAPDGVVRPRELIFVNNLPLLAFAALHCWVALRFIRTGR